MTESQNILHVNEGNSVNKKLNESKISKNESVHSDLKRKTSQSVKKKQCNAALRVAKKRKSDENEKNAGKINFFLIICFYYL